MNTVMPINLGQLIDLLESNLDQPLALGRPHHHPQGVAFYAAPAPNPDLLRTCRALLNSCGEVMIDRDTWVWVTAYGVFADRLGFDFAAGEFYLIGDVSALS